MGLKVTTAHFSYFVFVLLPTFSGHLPTFKSESGHNLTC
nr:MAG TPA: hypothetical protein [Caudoviricetes sp.]